MKNLANCNPTEFLRQTNKIRKSVEKWLTDTDIMNIRKRQPELPEGISDEDRKKAINMQAKKNLSAIFDAIMDEHPDETLEILALASFVEPKDINKHTVSEYLGSFAELMNNEEVVSFFTSLIALVQKIGIEV